MARRALTSGRDSIVRHEQQHGERSGAFQEETERLAFHCQ